MMIRARQDWQMRVQAGVQGPAHLGLLDHGTEVDICPCEKGSFKKFYAGGCVIYVSKGLCEPIWQGTVLMKGRARWKLSQDPRQGVAAIESFIENSTVAGSQAAELA